MKFFAILVPAAGVEPAIPVRNPIPDRARLPFRHTGHQSKVPDAGIEPARQGKLSKVWKTSVSAIPPIRQNNGPQVSWKLLAGQLISNLRVRHGKIKRKMRNLMAHSRGEILYVKRMGMTT